MSADMRLSLNSSTTRASDDSLPSMLKGVQNAKAVLMQCGASGDSLLSHLSNVVAKALDEGANVVDYFEQFSQKVRVETFRMNENVLEEGYKEPDRLAIAKKQLSILLESCKKPSTEQFDTEEEPGEECGEEEDTANETEPPTQTFAELQLYWNILGVGFPREEFFLLQQAILRASKNCSILSYRFWGKMLGLNNDYYVLECSLSEAALENRIDAIEQEINNMSLEPSCEQVDQKSDSILTATDSIENKQRVSELQKEIEDFPPNWNFSMKIAESQYRPPVEIPAEDTGHGANRWVYFVTTDLLGEWIELPPVTPHQINVSRRIKKYLTGNLNKEIVSYPEFPGTERNYLRALITRISASTSIAPRNFFHTGSLGGEEEDFDDEEAVIENDTPINRNNSYRPMPVANLQKLDYWEHTKPEILKQGRITFFDGNVLYQNSEEEEKSEASDEESEEPVKKIETPIPLFASCSGDRLVYERMSPWSIRLCDFDQKIVFVQSHNWPGAFALAKERIWDNIYIGYGVKRSLMNYAPPPIPMISSEYPFGIEITEQNDPTVEDEEIFEKNHEIESEVSCDELEERECD